MVDFEVSPLPETDHVEAGERAPGFTRPLVNEEYWEDASLSELTDDGPVVLVFHTMDGDFPATYVWKNLVDRAWDERYGVTVVGLSVSSPYEHAAFIEDEPGVEEYELFSDPGNGVAEAYGVVNELDGMAGIEEARPAVFVIDEDRTVEYAWVSREWPEFPPYDEVEDAVADVAD